ncbi:hypothetical protein HZA45_03045 [Candidatus Peregrinibacteria bacterium]|nr:hypothetical protein [Candidatus Peregrinibacteria bacterium]
MAKAKSDVPSSERNVISIELAPSPARTPGQQRVFEERISGIARHVERRMHNMVIELAPERAKRLEAAVKRIKTKELKEMIEGDLECNDEQEWGQHAFGTMSFIDRHLGIEPRIPRAKLKSLNLDSPTLVRDVLALAEGANQDIGFFMVQETPEGEKKVGFDEMDLAHLNHTLTEEGKGQ